MKSITGPFAGTGGVLAAVGASACCILPFAAGVAGLSGAAFGSFFEPFRPYMAVLSVGLLGWATYTAFLRKGKVCRDGVACAVKRGKGKVMKSFVLGAWLFSGLSFSFPYLLAMNSSAHAEAPAETGGLVTAVYRVDGMTCEGCAAGIEARLKELPGMAYVDVSYEDGKAECRFDPTVTDAQVCVNEINGSGYRAELVSLEEL